LIERCVGLRGIVQDQWDEAADESHPELVELSLERVGLVGEESRCAQLGGREPHRHHLGQHAIDRQHASPTRHLADAP
jgi:hypothetical protein